MGKMEFFNILKGKNLDNMGYSFSWGNDEYSSPYHQKRTASYIMKLIDTNGQEIILEEATTRKNIEEKQQELICKYSAWAKKFKVSCTH